MQGVSLNNIAVFNNLKRTFLSCDTLSWPGDLSLRTAHSPRVFPPWAQAECGVPVTQLHCGRDYGSQTPALVSWGYFGHQLFVSTRPRGRPRPPWPLSSSGHMGSGGELNFLPGKP
jgi:hypothetical protein